jgi:hypothetical protein
VTTDPIAIVLFERAEPEVRDIAAALERALGADTGPDDPTPSSSPIALPADDGGPVRPPRLREAEIAVVLDPESAERAREAGVRRIVAVCPFLAVEWDEPLVADLVLVAHDAAVEDAVAQGARRERVRVCGPIAPEGWGPAEDRDALRAELGLRADVPWVVVRASALDRDDLAPSLVQLSLVRVDAAWLFDVGADPDLARALRRHVPGYGLDATMFADGQDALRAYQAADLVFGRLEGPEAIRAISVGAALATVAPEREQVRFAHLVEESGIAAVADAAATVAVTLDAALTEGELRRGRASSRALDAKGGAERAAGFIGELARGDLGGAPVAAGLPRGLERLSEPDAERPARAPDDDEHPRKDEDLDKKVDEELAALRAKLGL